MLSFLVLLVLCTGTLVNGNSYSFSPSVGSGLGTSFSLMGTERIDAVRVYETANAYITGIQIRFGGIWSNLAGRVVGSPLEITLFPDEFISQVSGKYHSSNYIYQLSFTTSTGRSLSAGQPIQKSFNLYPQNNEQQLIIVSGRYNSAGITAIAAHWATDNSTSTS